eukprot:983981-Prymnesium_polylepis.1
MRTATEEELREKWCACARAVRRVASPSPLPPPSCDLARARARVALPSLAPPSRLAGARRVAERQGARAAFKKRHKDTVRQLKKRNDRRATLNRARE